MITCIRIPQAFENMEEATIGRWLKREGDLLRNGDALCELITEKTTFDLPVEHLTQPEYLRRIVAPEKSIVPVGYIIAVAGDGQDVLPDVDLENEALLQIKSTAVREAIIAEPVAPIAAPPRTAPAAGTRLRATPAARRVAKERGIDLEELAQKLGGKVITEEDVLTA